MIRSPMIYHYCKRDSKSKTDGQWEGFGSFDLVLWPTQDGGTAAVRAPLLR